MDLTQNDLFNNLAGKNLQIADGAMLLPGFELANDAQILADLNAILSASNFSLASTSSLTNTYYIHIHFIIW